MRLFVLATVAALLMAGCASKTETTVESETFTCPDGTVVDLDNFPNHHDADFNATRDACPQPAPPTIVVSVPTTLAAYAQGEVLWSLSGGDYTGAHSMYNTVRLSNVSVSDAAMGALAKPQDYGQQELGTMEHQNLPAGPFNATFSVATPGMYYVRGVARILADGLPEKIYYTPEVMLNITPVVLTGVTATVTHGAGNTAGGITPASTTIALGDAVIFKNDDITTHVFSLQSGPKGATFEDLSVGMRSESDPVPFVVPGSYTFKTDDVQAVTFTIDVTV